MSGVILSGDTSGTVSLQVPAVAGTNIITVPASTGTLALTSQIPTITGFKNRIINGDMRIDQRNAGTSVTVNDAAPYVLDRYFAQDATDGVFTVQQSSVAPVGFINSMLVTVTTADSSLSASQLARIVQRIEGLNISDLGWGTSDAKTVTVSFWVRSSLTGTFGGSLANGAFNRSYPFSYTISSANTWEQKTITIAGDTTGTWLTTNGVGIELNIGLGVGSTYSGTANTWAAAGYMAPTGATSVIGTNGATFYITGVQLEVGSAATSFEVRDFGRELQLCQRYYEKSYDIGVKPGTASTGGMLATFPATYAIYFTSDFKVTKRAGATVTWYSSYSGAAGNYAINGVSDAAIVALTANTNGCSSYTGTLPGNVSAYVQYTANAEL